MRIDALVLPSGAGVLDDHLERVFLGPVVIAEHRGRHPNGRAANPGADMRSSGRLKENKSVNPLDGDAGTADREACDSALRPALLSPRWNRKTSARSARALKAGAA